VRRRWLSRRALLLHLVVAIWVPGCAVAAWWQVTVALAGDRLGYLYSVEWPCFAVFGAVVWWNLVHDDPDAVGARALRRARSAGVTVDAGEVLAPTRAGAELDEARIRALEEHDPELAAYNDYLARLASGDGHPVRQEG
jgi:DNA-binding transcriptional regulator of glucitol operon